MHSASEEIATGSLEVEKQHQPFCNKRGNYSPTLPLMGVGE